LLGGALVMGQIGVSIATSAGWIYFFLILVPGLIFVYNQSQSEDKEIQAKHTGALEEYNQKYLCLRCETIFNPFAKNEDATASVEVSLPVGPLIIKPQNLSIGEWQEQVIKANGIVREGGGYQWRGQYFNSFSEAVDAINVGRS